MSGLGRGLSPTVEPFGLSMLGNLGICCICITIDRMLLPTLKAGDGVGFSAQYSPFPVPGHYGEKYEFPLFSPVHGLDFERIFCPCSSMMPNMLVLICNVGGT